jgi:hypothetical protein
VYRVLTGDDASYFLKVRKSVTNASSLLVPRYLHDHGPTQVAADTVPASVTVLDTPRV